MSSTHRNDGALHMPFPKLLAIICEHRHTAALIYGQYFKQAIMVNVSYNRLRFDVTH